MKPNAIRFAIDVETDKINDGWTPIVDDRQTTVFEKLQTMSHTIDYLLDVADDIKHTNARNSDLRTLLIDMDQQISKLSTNLGFPALSFTRKSS